MTTPYVWRLQMDATYVIDVEQRRVYVFPDPNGGGYNFNRFEFLEDWTGKSQLAEQPERHTAYLIARDELIERGLINPGRPAS